MTSKSVVISYSISSFASACLHTLFISYYVDVFRNWYYLEDDAFYWGEFIFLIWNSVNDPLFGWWFDRRRQMGYKNVRVDGIRWGGLLWCFAFLITFLPIDFVPKWFVGFHFTICICLYDTMLSYVMLAHNSLLADLTLSSSERAQCNKWNSIMGALGSTMIFFTPLFYRGKDSLFSFQLFCAFISFISLLAFNYTATHLVERNTVAEQQEQRDHQPNDKKSDINNLLSDLESTTISISTFLKQILSHTNFWLFVGVNLVQVFNCHFNSNFLTIFLEGFIGKNAPILVQSSILALACILPHVFVVLLEPIIKSYGLYAVLMALFVLKLCFAGSFWMFLDGEGPFVLIGIYLLFNKSFSECICRHGNLVVADLIDEDFVRNGRHQSLSSAIHGTNAFFTKPGQSLAAMVGWKLLSNANFMPSSRLNYFDDVVDQVEIEVTPNIRSQLFQMAVLIPICCGIIQIILWFQFSLKGAYLQKVKHQRNKVENFEASDEVV